MSIAVVGLVASAFVPMAYCQYGCPTGAALDFVRSRGKSDRFGLRDGVALGLTGLVFLGWQFYDQIQHWIVS